MINSKMKGKHGEIELANILKSKGFTDARRGQQFSGIEGKDVVGLEGIHIECKRVQSIHVYKAIEQAKQDADEGELPTVMFRRDRSEWLVLMTLEDWLKLYEGELRNE